MGSKDIDDRFKRFGTVSFSSVTQVNDFIDHLEQGKVMGTRCKESGHRYFPPRAHCSRCLTSEMEWFEVSGTGRLVSYSTLKYAPTGFSDDLPYTIALLDYGDYQVFGRLDRDLPVESVEIGMELETAVRRIDDDRLTYVFQRPE